MANSLPSVMERDEHSGPPANARTPVKSPSQRTARASHRTESSGAKTPTSVSAARPTLNEMHPSKVRQSTTKQPDSGLVLGFNPVKKDANGNIVKDTVVHDTPSKAKASPSHQFGTPGYEFRFSCQESQLSDEAKRLMESVREDVANIKTQMVQGQGKQTHTENAAEGLHGDRKFAKPKSKTGRFSDAHMSEFKKMDSIAGHASAFRATPGHFQPVAKSLKRTNSKARLDEPNEQASPSKAPAKRSPAPAAAGAKRARYDATDDASTRRPSSKDGSAPKPVNRRPRNIVRGSLMTPTKSSMARTSASVRPSKTSKIPSLVSPSKAAETPHTPRTDFNPRFKSKLPTLSGLKSILRDHRPLFSKDPTKIASGTHAAAPDFSSDMLLAGARGNDEPQTPSPKKHVDFSSSAKSRHELAQASPSPTKIPSLRPGSDIAYPALPAMTPEKASTPAKPTNDQTKATSVRQVRTSDAAAQPILNPEIPGVPHGIGNKKRNREETNDDAGDENVPPPDAIERSTKRVKVNAPPANKRPTPSPIKAHPNTPRRITTSRAGTPASAKQRKGALSVGRLNMLATPKRRA
ncbi:erythromycin esterase [Aspergillus sp. HF37]|nr:erythromycin esterase [Aspergillus sp. HF37]